MARLILSRTAEKSFSRLQAKDKRKIIKKLRLIESEPLVGKKLRGELRGLFSLRAWPYGIIYEKKAGRVIVHNVSHRQKAYKKV